MELKIPDNGPFRPKHVRLFHIYIHTHPHTHTHTHTGQYAMRPAGHLNFVLPSQEWFTTSSYQWHTQEGVGCGVWLPGCIPPKNLNLKNTDFETPWYYIFMLFNIQPTSGTEICW